MVWALLGASIESVKIPASVTSIGEGVFRNCSLLSSITYTGTLEEWKTSQKDPFGAMEFPRLLFVALMATQTFDLTFM